MIPTRRISFEADLESLPQLFANGDPIMSHVFAVLSSLFPDGEDFFVRSVRHYRDQIEDPELRRAVSGFIGQESVHGREHRQFNARLAELGYPTQRIERMVRKGLAFRSRVAPPIANLASTAALEHITAVLAEQGMTDPEALDLLGHGLVRDLFIWHALEESEHKAVAFDVYRSVGGGERLRIWTMKVTRLGVMATTAIEVSLSLFRSRRTFERGELRASWQRFRTGPVLQRATWDQLREYDRVGFHPNDRDATELVEFWRDALFGESGALNDRLQGVAA